MKLKHRQQTSSHGKRVVADLQAVPLEKMKELLRGRLTLRGAMLGLSPYPLPVEEKKP